MLDFQHIGVSQDRIVDLQNLTVLRLLFQEVAVFSDVNGRAGDDLLTDRIDGRVCYLGKKLFEIVEQGTDAVLESTASGVSTPMAAVPSPPFNAISRMDFRYSS